MTLNYLPGLAALAILLYVNGASASLDRQTSAGTTTDTASTHASPLVVAQSKTKAKTGTTAILGPSDRPKPKGKARAKGKDSAQWPIVGDLGKKGGQEAKGKAKGKKETKGLVGQSDRPKPKTKSKSKSKLRYIQPYKRN